MRRIPTGLRLLRSSCGVLTLFVVLSTTLVAQTGSANKKKAEPAPDTSPLARYAPRENLFFYAEFAGLDAHQEAWRKTAAYKMLNETTLGAMLEDVGSQLVERMLKELPNRRVTGAEVVKLLEHFARSGVVLGAAQVPDHPAKGAAFLVLRGAAKREIRETTGRLLLMIGGEAAKPELAKRPSGRQIVVMKRAQPDSLWAWWAEKDDVVIALNGPESADVLAEVIDGKRPNAIEHPIRTELEKPEDGMEPVGLGFIDPAGWKTPQAGLGTFFDTLQRSGVSRFDYRWGPAGDALMTVARVKSKTPRQGLLTLLDQPTFDKKALITMPEGVTAFTALSMNPAQVFDVVSTTVKSANPAAGTAIDDAVEVIRSRTRLQLRKDILAHLGPKAMFYTVPTAPPAAAKPATANNTTTNAGAGGLSPLGLLAGAGSVPKFVLMVEIDDPKAFERSLDALVIELNKEIRGRIQEKAAEVEAAAAAAAAENDPAQPGQAGDDSSRRRRFEAPPTPEFKMMPGQVKSYIFNVPSEFGKMPAGLRPTIRVGSKHVVFASSPEVARQALEVKKEASWIPVDEFAAALDLVPENLVYLHVEDPREQMPKRLASLPGELQKGINAAMILSRPQPSAGDGPAPGAPGAAPGSEPGAPGLVPPPGAGLANPPGIPGAPATPAQAGAAKSPETPFVLRIDPAKLPSETALKALLFPSTTAVSVTDQEFRFVSRVAFPTLITPDSSSSMVVSAMLRPAIQNAVAAARRAAQGQPGATAPPDAAAPANPGP